MNRTQFVENAPRYDWTWVPTVHSLPRVLDLYLNFLRANLVGLEGESIRGAFQRWLVDNHSLQLAAAGAYCFPLSDNEFNLWAYTANDIEVLLAGGPAALELWQQRRTLSHDIHTKRPLVCLNDARLVGILGAITPALTLQEKQAILVEVEYAGVLGSATAIMTVGLSVGRHFGLLDNQGLPTEFFEPTFDSIEDGSALNTFL